MKIQIEIDEAELKRMIKEKIENTMNAEIKESNIEILVKSKQNYRAEWEVAQFKATYEHK